MKRNTIYAGCLLAASIALSGCDGDVESMGDITVNVEGDVVDNSVTNNNTEETSTDTGPTGLCAEVTEASFVSFNSDCSQGTISGTVDSDYTLIEDVEYILSGVVTVGAGCLSVLTV